MADEMFFTNDEGSLRRGRRRAPRTEVCRPCIIWPEDAPDMAFQGVVIDVTPYGMCIRMLDHIPVGTKVQIQLMRDEEFKTPLAEPHAGMIVRLSEADEGFVDHGVQLQIREIKRVEQARPVSIERRRTVVWNRRSAASRMHTLDITVGDRGARRTEE